MKNRMSSPRELEYLMKIGSGGGNGVFLSTVELNRGETALKNLEDRGLVRSLNNGYNFVKTGLKFTLPNVTIPGGSRASKFFLKISNVLSSEISMHREDLSEEGYGLTDKGVSLYNSFLETYSDQADHEMLQGLE